MSPKKSPQVREFMTPMPHTINADLSLEAVDRLMDQFRVRHLPVKKGGRVVGIVSDRNVKEAMAVREKAPLTAEDIMIPDPFRVPAHVGLQEVAAAMAEEKYGSALVQDDTGELVGIFTSVDACRALRQILETLYPE